MSDDALRATEMMIRLVTPLLKNATKGISGVATAGIIGTIGLTWMAGRGISAAFKGMADFVHHVNENPQVFKEHGEITMKKLLNQETTGIHITRLLDTREFKQLRDKLQECQVAFAVEHTNDGAYIHLETEDIPRLDHAMEAIQPELNRLRLKELEESLKQIEEGIPDVEERIAQIEKELPEKQAQLDETNKRLEELSQRENVSAKEREALQKQKATLEHDINELKLDRPEMDRQIKIMEENREDWIQEKSELEQSLGINQSLPADYTIAATDGTVIAQVSHHSVFDNPEPTQDLTPDGNLSGQDVPTQRTAGGEYTQTTTQPGKKRRTMEERAKMRREQAYKSHPDEARDATKRAGENTQDGPEQKPGLSR